MLDDIKILKSGKCPVCETPFRTYMPFEPHPPMCHKCDMFFEVLNGIICRNTEATKTMNEHWDLLKQGYSY